MGTEVQAGRHPREWATLLQPQAAVQSPVLILYLQRNNDVRPVVFSLLPKFLSAAILLQLMIKTSQEATS